MESSRRGELTCMSERQILYRLVGDVEGLKSEAKNHAESQKASWVKIDSIRDELNECNRKLDRVLLAVEGNAGRMDKTEKRVEEVEKGVESYRRDKNRVIAWIIGLCTGAGALGGGAATIILKLFNGKG